MAISIRCKNSDCGKPFRVKDESAGKAVKCPACGQRITVPPKPASPPVPRSSKLQSDEEDAPSEARHRSHAASRALWPWLVGLVAMLLVGAGGGYFFASSQNRNDGDRTGQTDPKTQELAAANTDLSKQLAAAEDRVKEALATNADLTKQLAKAEEGVKTALAASTDLTKRLATAEARAKEAEQSAKVPNPPSQGSPSTPPTTNWQKAFGIKLVVTVKKANLENVDSAQLPKSEGLDFDKMLPKSQLAMAKGIGESTEVKTPGEFGLIATLRIGRDDSTAWPSDGKAVENMHFWGQVLVGKKLLRYNLLLTGTPAADGVIRGKARGSLATGFNFQNADFEMRPIRDEFDRDPEKPPPPTQSSGDSSTSTRNSDPEKPILKGQPSPLNSLDPGKVTQADRPAKQSAELVAVLPDAGVCVAFSPDQKTIATSGGKGVSHLWDSASAIKRDQLEGHSQPIYSMTFSPDSSRVASGSGGLSLRIWEVASPKPKPMALLEATGCPAKGRG